MMPLLEVRNLSYHYPDGTPALNGISLQVGERENVALLGPNGSGKTTLLLHLNGTLSGQGSVTIAGLKVNKHTLKDVRRQVGIVFQDPDQQLFMPTVLEDVMFGLQNLGSNREEAQRLSLEALTKVGLSPEDAGRAPFHLSAGEKRRVALAGVLVMEPKVLLLDEPTSWLDPPGQRGLLELLTQLPQPKLVATHDAAFARALTQRGVFLQSGRIVADGPVQQVIERFQWHY
jgi:cobalt/nickel transport system ATP-binding protein